MKTYGPSDLVIQDDAVALLLRRPDMYLRRPENPPAADFALAVMSDIIALNALPAQVGRDDDWWVISAERDWLANSGFGEPTSLFFRICPFPARGQNNHRAEIALTAFADDVVTGGPEGVVWIKGNRAKRRLPRLITQRDERFASGRILAFTRDAEPHPFAPVVVWFMPLAQ
jgi:hypothetical protein